MQFQALCIILSSPYWNSNSSYSPETAKFGFEFFDLELLPLTLTFCTNITSVNGDNSWKFHNDIVMGTQWKGCGGWTDWTIHTAAWPQLNIWSSSYRSLNIFFPWLWIFPVNAIVIKMMIKLNTWDSMCDEESGHYFADNIFNCIMLNRNPCILMKKFPGAASWSYNWQQVQCSRQ